MSDFSPPGQHVRHPSHESNKRELRSQEVNIVHFATSDASLKWSPQPIKPGVLHIFGTTRKDPVYARATTPARHLSRKHLDYG